MLALAVLAVNSAMAQAPAESGGGPSCAEIQQALQKIAGEFDNCHLVLATRGGTSPIPAGTTTRPATRFFDVWMIGEDVQILNTMSNAQSTPNWWDGFVALEKPLTTATLDSREGQKTCGRSTGDIVWADYTAMPPGKRQQYPSLYSTNRSPKPVGLFVPFLEMNRKWSRPFAGGWPVVNAIAEIDPSKWRMIGPETLDGARTVKVEVEAAPPGQLPLKRHEGKLAVTNLWVCWFSLDQGFLPLKIVKSLRYHFGGREYPYELPPGANPMAVYESTVGQVAGKTWFPISGSQKTYGVTPKR